MNKAPRRWGLFPALIVTLAPLSAAVLTGRVYSDQGAPVGGAVVGVQSTVVTSSALASYGAVTDAQGKFTLDLPDAATYSVCVGAFDRSLLNSCEWSLQQSLVQIAKGQTAVAALITLQTGVKLHIRLDDPQQLLPSATTAAASGVRFQLWGTDGNYHTASEVSGDEKGRNIEILLPPKASFKIATQSGSAQALPASIPGQPAFAGSVTSDSSLPQLLKFQVAPVAATTAVK